MEGRDSGHDAAGTLLGLDNLRNRMHQGIGIQRDAVDPLFNQKLCKLGIVAGRLTADADLAPFGPGLLNDRGDHRFDGGVALVEDVRGCERSPAEPVSGFSPSFQVALPYRGMFVWHVGRDEVVGDPNQVFKGKIMLSAKRFPLSAKSKDAYISAVRKQSSTNFQENKANGTWKIYFAAFLSRPLNDVEYVIKFYDLSGGTQQLLGASEALGAS